jgi:ParB-like chromosome segregation protein Spo0J
MIKDHGYSVRRLAQKVGKDKGYLENRLRLADAPPEIRELVSVRKDTLSHAYELMKVEDPRRRKRLAAQVASGQLSLMKLRERIEGRPASQAAGEGADASARRSRQVAAEPAEEAVVPTAGPPASARDDALQTAKSQLNEALHALAEVLRSPEFDREASSVDRQNLAKYLTISKLTLENAITVARGQGPRDRV